MSENRASCYDYEAKEKKNYAFLKSLWGLFLEIAVHPKIHEKNELSFSYLKRPVVTNNRADNEHKQKNCKELLPLATNFCHLKWGTFPTNN